VTEAVFERAPLLGPEPDARATRPHSLPPPDDEEVERLLRTVALRVVRLFRKQGKLDNVTSDGVLDALQARAPLFIAALLVPAAARSVPERARPGSGPLRGAMALTQSRAPAAPFPS
jgi:hypothetical protein